MKSKQEKGLNDDNKIVRKGKRYDAVCSYREEATKKPIINVRTSDL